jgi:hypothetical protein
MHVTTAGMMGITKYAKSGRINSEHNTAAADEQKQLSKGTSLAPVVITMVRTITAGTKGIALGKVHFKQAGSPFS